MTLLLVYIPFVNPLNIFHEWWYLLLAPLAFGISMIYKAVRMHVLHGYWREVLMMTMQIILAMIGLAIALIVFVRVLIPMLPVD